MPTLYQFEACHECAAVRRALRGRGIAFETVNLPLGDKAIVRTKFGVESVPVYVDGKFVSHDLTAILRRIAG